MVRAESRRLVGGRQSRRRLAAGEGPSRRPEHRTVGPDARRHAARRLRPGAAPGHPLERRPQRRRMPGDRSRRAAQPNDHRQPRHARLHGAEAGVGAHARTRGVRGGAHGAAAERLRAAAPDRGQGHRSLGCQRDALGRRRPAHMVAADAGHDRPQRGAHADAQRGPRADRPAARRGGRGVGHGARAGGRRRRRQRRGRGRRRRRQPGRRPALAGHLRRLVRRRRRVPAQSRTRRARLLPRACRAAGTR